MKRDDLVPLKKAADELGVSRMTLWRASRAMANFPGPVIIRRLVYWKREDMPRLEDALGRYEGRVKFERAREAQQKIDRLRSQRPAPTKANRRRSRTSSTLADLELESR